MDIANIKIYIDIERRSVRFERHFSNIVNLKGYKGEKKSNRKIRRNDILSKEINFRMIMEGKRNRK